MKNVLCMWSGGIDSTYMIWKYLYDYEVDAFYCEIDNNKNKVKNEKNAIRKMLPELKKYRFKYLGVMYKCFTKGYGLDMVQPVVWIQSIIHQDLSKYDEVAIGYVMNDDAVSYIEDIKKTYYSYQPFTKNKLPPLKFPLIKTRKNQSFYELPENLIKSSVFCEGPEKINDICGECGACIRRFGLEIREEIPKEFFVMNKNGS